MTDLMVARWPVSDGGFREEHAVAVGEEAVFFADGVGVGGEDCFPALFFPAKALTSIRRVDWGRWKLVRRPVMMRNLWPGLRKMLVWPEWGSSLLSPEI